MNNSKFSLADVIIVLTAVGFGFVCFLGINFYTLGDTNQSIIKASIITVVLSGIAIGVKWLKQTRCNFKTYLIWEIILLVLFTGLMVYFTVSPFSHYFLVSEQKVEIQEKLTASIVQAENMFNDYEQDAKKRMSNYEGKLQSVVATKNNNKKDFDSLGFLDTGVSYSKQIENKMNTMNFDLFPSNFKSMKTADFNLLSKYKVIVTDWRPIGVIEVIKNLEQNTSNTKTNLLSISTRTQTLEKPTKLKIKPSLVNVKKYFTTLGKPTLLSIGLAAVAWLLMLLSWITTKRDKKAKGATQTATYEVVL